ncbi:MAG: class I SAM-dependent methyltransferase [Pyrinomonadaceae bacterium]
MKRSAGMMEKLKRPLRAPYYYFRLRAKALRLGFEEWKRTNGSDNTPPIPPPLLRHRVGGTLDAAIHLKVGRICAQNLKDMLGRIGKDIYSFSHVLDFGCGSGRVMSHFHDRPESCHLYATDIDKQAISWCREHLRFACWEANDAMPPTRYADNTFDFIYAISVFTHLDEKMQFAWLHELKRVAKPDAILILSVHGTAALSQWSESDRELASKMGFFHKVVRKGVFNRHGLPDFYQTSQHSREYVEANWSRLFKIVEYVEAGINEHQDAVILQNL